MELPVKFGAISEKTLEQFRKINESTLEVKYSENFYQSFLAKWTKYSWFAYVSDITVGALSAREEERNGEPGVYVMTCSVLKPYRRNKVATKLMNHLFEALQEEGAPKLVFMHVWTVSEDSLAFYRHLGFEVTETLEGYYKDIEPQTAYVLEKRVS